MSYKVETFKTELDLVKDTEIKNFAIQAVEMMPDYFFKIPASSTGKYHPSYALGDGGLVRHTKAAVRIGLEMARLSWWNLTDTELDLIIVSLILHDGWKKGIVEEKFTVDDHPVVAASFLRNNRLAFNIRDEWFYIITDAISRHMGAWNRDKKTGFEFAPRPKTKIEKFVHEMDYLASRKMLEVNFDIEPTRP